jgi:hypothetical protein
LRGFFHSDIGRTGHFAAVSVLLFLLQFAPGMALTGLSQSGGFWTLNNMLLLAGILLAILFALDGYTRSKEGRLRRKPAVPQGPQDNRLPAISAGVVFRDANSYTGNAPDFMAKSVVERINVRMADFLAYKGLSLLVPSSIFGAVTFIFFT